MKPMWEIKQPQLTETLELYIYGDVEAGYFDWGTSSYTESENSAKNSGKS